MGKELKLRLDCSIVPKARPRGGTNGYYLPERYRLWRADAVVQLRQQMRGGFVFGDEPVAVDIKYKGNRRGDADNLAGAVLDALVDASVLKNDSLKYICKLSFSWERASKGQVEITISSVV